MTVLPSRRLGVVIFLTHCLAAFACVAAFQGVVLFLLLAGVVLAGARELALALHWTRDSIVSISFSQDDSGEYVSRTGTRHALSAIRASWVSPIAVVLQLIGPQRDSRWLVLLSDASDEESLRRLRRRCR